MSWQGRVHHPDLTDGRAVAVVELHPGAIRATAEGQSFEFSLHDLQLEIGGLEHDTLYIRSGGAKEPLLVVRDPSFAASLSELNIPEVRSTLKRGDNKRKKRKFTSIVGWSTVVLLFVGIFFTPLGPNLLISMIPESVDESIGKAAFESAVRSMTGQYLPVKDEKVTQAMEVIRKRLESGVQNRRFNYRIEVFESPLVNAIALPGGHIAVFSGLIEKAESPEELAGVIAHEMMHAEKRHGVRQILRQMGFFIGLQLLLGDAEGLIGLVADGAALLARLDYSRSMENQADEEGALVMVRAKISPMGMATFFEKLASMSEEATDSNEEETDADEEGLDFSWLRTHPDTEERIEHIREIYEDHDDVKYAPLRVDWRGLKRSITAR